MSVTIPPDAGVFARIKTDFRARRGPFRYAVVMAHELVAEYDVRFLKITQARWALRQIGTREAVLLVTPRCRYFVVDRSLGDIKPREARSLFLQERGLAQ